MDNGQMGIFPEDNVNRLSNSQYEIHNTDNDLIYRDPEALKDTLTLHSIPIKRATHIKVVGNYIMQNGSDTTQRREMINKASKAWSKITHQINKSRFFSIESWIKL